MVFDQGAASPLTIKRMGLCASLFFSGTELIEELIPSGPYTLDYSGENRYKSKSCFVYG